MYQTQLRVLLRTRGDAKYHLNCTRLSSFYLNYIRHVEWLTDLVMTCIIAA